MKLICFQGLNCYHACIITLAHHAGYPYEQSFSRLWSEGNPRFDPIGRVFLTRRMPQALESMGMYLEEPAVTLPGRRHSWSEVSENAFALVGMDAFQVPWTPLFGLQHGPHYYIAQKKNGDAQFCIDPTYGIENQTLSSAQLYEKSYAMIPVYITDKPAGFPENPASAAAQAHEVLQSHPKTLKFFISQAEKWIREDPETALHPAKFTDALLTGRRLYRRFLEKNAVLEQASLFESREYFAAWQAVKNGFYKAALRLREPEVFEEACRNFSALLKQEMDFAAGILEKDRT